MPPDIVGLLTLQERDQRLQELRKELERIPREQDLARERLATHQQAVEEAKASTSKGKGSKTKSKASNGTADPGRRR